MKVTAAFSELIPPSITLISYPIDTAYTSGPFNITAKITDGSGIDTALLIYSTSTGFSDTIGMSQILIDTFSATIPFHGFGRTIFFTVKAIDASAALNAATAGPIDFFCKNSPGGTGVIGTGTSTSGYPFYTLYEDSRTQMLYTAAELNAAGVFAGQVVSLGLNVTSPNSTPMNGFNIKLKNSSATSLSSFDLSNLTTVYSGTHTTTTGWNVFTLSTPFVWDGSSNLLVDICFDNTAWSGSSSVASTTMSNMAVHEYDDGVAGCSFVAGTPVSSRPNLQITIQSSSALTNDIGISQITNPTGGVLANQAFDIKVKIKNFGIDTLHTASVSWKFDGVAQTPYSFTGSLLPDSLSSEIILGSKTVAGGSHSLTAWTNNPNGIPDFDVSNDSSTINFFACSSLLNGTYTIGGTSADYATFTDAVLALNQCGINGPVVFNVAAGTYNEKIEIFSINGSSSTNTVTFKAANGDSTSVILKNDATGTVDNYVIKLNGASYTTFKNMTIEAADSTYCRAFVLGGALHDVNILNNIIKSTVAQITDASSGTLILTQDSLGHNISIINNAILNGSRGMSLFAATPKTGWQVKNNNFNGFFSTGIALTKGQSSVVEGNKIETTTSPVSFNGITMSNCSGTPNVSKNKITTTATTVAYGIVANNSIFDSINPAMIYNNFILLNGNSAATTLTGGILVLNSPFIKMYYNTVHITGNQTVSASLILYDQTATPNTKDITIKNNIFTNAASGYIYYTSAIDTADFVNNYNNIYNWNQGKFGRIGTTDITTFANWKTQSGGETLGDTINPYYTSATDLHVNNNLLNGRAIPVLSISDDIDGELRNSTNPDFGADEFLPSPYDITTLEVLTPAGACGLDTNETVTVRYKNVGSATISGNLTASYKIIGTATVVTETVSTSITAGDTLDFVFATKANLSVANIGFDSTFVIKAWADLTGDNVPQNDTVLGEVESGYVPGLVIIADDTVQYGQKDTLYASGTNIYWWLTDTSSIELMNDTMFITPNLYDTTTYWVSDRAGSGIMDVAIGNGTGVNGSSAYPSTYGNYFWGNKEQYLILASELQAMGLSSGPLNAVSFEVSALNSLPPLDNVEISIGHTNTTSIAAWETNLSTVFSQASAYMPTAGWNIHNFSAPFIWDGSSNIVIQMCSNNSSWVSGGNAGVLNHATTFNATLNTHADAAGVCSNTGLTAYASRPNMKLKYEGQGCFGERSPVTVYVTGFPQYDAALDSLLLSPYGNIPAGTPLEIKSVLHNYGQIPLTSVKIPYSINGVIQDTLNWTGNLVYNAFDTIVIDTVTLGGGMYNFKAYTTLPNNVADIYNTNDTSKSMVQSCLNGTYTIGKPANGTFDFPSFTAAKIALANAGVCGHVIFDVDSGIYNEQVIFNSIPGAGPNSTITFKSATGDSSLVIWQYQPTSTTDNYIVKWDGVKYLTLKQMTLKITNTTSGTYGTVLDLTAGAARNKLLNCVLISPVSTSASANPIYLNGTNVHYNTFENNILKNGYYGIRLYGVGSSNLSKGNKFINNTVQDFSYTGMYFYYQDSLEVIGNTIQNLNGFTSGYGIYAGYCQNDVKILKNKIALAPTGTVYGGIYMYFSTGTAARKGLIANNFVSITGSNTSGTHYGIRGYYSYYHDFLFNSINMDAGAVASRGLDIYYGGTNNVLNNNVRTDGSYAYYVQSSSSITNSNYNNFYSTGTNYAFWNTNAANLAALKTASSMEANTLSANVMFVDSINLHLLSTALSSKGIASPRVTIDIDGELRSSIPTIGADEVPLIPIDGGVSIVVVPGSTTNEFDTIHPKVIICNYGSDSLFSIPVSYNVNGSNPITTTFVAALAPVSCDTFDLPYFISPAGNSTICAKTQVIGDTNLFNDETCKSFFGVPQKDAQAHKILTLAEGCGLSTDTINLLIKNLGATVINSNIIAKYKVVGGSNIVSQAVTQSIPVGDSIWFKFTTPVNLAVTTVDSTFAIKAWVEYVGDNVQYNDTAITTTESFHTPPAPTVTNVTIPYGTPANLFAVSPTNDTLLWYDQQFSGNQLYQGNNYHTPVMYLTDSVWVEARGGAPAAVVTLGTGTDQNANTGYPAPYGNWYWGAKHQFLVQASELVALGAVAGPISSLAFDVVTANAVALQGFEIKMGHTAQSSLSSNFITNTTAVYSSGSYTETTGWNTHVFQTPFIWNGYDNIVIETCFNNSTYTYNAVVNRTSMSFNASLYYNDDASGICSIAAGTTSTLRPNMQLMLEPTGCSSPRTPLVVTVGNPSANDAGVYKIVTPSTSVYLNSQETVKVKIRNYGTNSISNFPVSYKLDAAAPVTETVSVTIPSQDSLEYTFSTKANLNTVGNTYSFKAYTSLNGDATAMNDTTSAAVTNLVPNYCNSSATNTSYSEITNVSFGTSFSNSSPLTNALYTNFMQSVAPGQLPIATPTNFSITSAISPGSSTNTTTYIKIYIDYNRNGVFDVPTEEVYAGTSTTAGVLSDVFTVPSNVNAGVTAMRVVMQVYSSLNAVSPCGTYSYGETEDYNVIIAPRISHDAGVELFINPQTVAATSVVPVNVRVRNFGTDTINSFSIAYELNGGNTVTTPITATINPLDSADFSLGNITLQAGANQLCAYTILTGDSNTINDQRCKSIFLEAVVPITYIDNFEGSDLWMPDTITNQWVRGVPAKTNITAAHSPVNAWITGLSGNYNNGSNDFLYSPRILIPNTSDSAYLKFWHYYDMQSGTTGDGGRLEFKINSGNWASLGYIGDPMSTNWLTTNIGGTHMWNGNSNGWVESKYSMNFIDPISYFYGAKGDTVQFRFVFYSNSSTNNYSGWAIDDFEVSLPTIAQDGGVSSIISPSVSTQTGSVVSVSVEVKNFGTQNLVSIPVAYKVNNGSWVNEVFTPTNPIAPNATGIYNFTTTFTSPGLNYLLCAKTAVVGDIYTANDQFCSSINATAAAYDGEIALLTVTPIWLGGTAIDTTKQSFNIFPIAKVKNMGTNALTDVIIEYSINSLPWVTDTIVGTLNSHDSIIFLFSTPYSGPIGTYTLNCRLIVPNDADLSNNLKTKQLFGKLDVGFENDLNGGFMVNQNEPNPAKDKAIINYTIPNSGMVKFELRNTLGQLILNTNDNKIAGQNAIEIDVESLSNGVYYYTIEYNKIRKTMKMIINK